MKVKRRQYEGRDGGESMTAAHTSGVQTCGSPWACPVCAAKIRQRRAVEIEDVLTRHLEAGGGAQFLTLTMPHDAGDDLESLFEAVSYAWDKVNSGRAWQRQKKRRRFIGYIKALEVTFGASGWHPHLHVVLLFEKRLPEHERRAFETGVHERWSDAIERRGYRRPRRSLCPMEPVNRPAELSKYISGQGALARDNNSDLRHVGLEMMRGDLKAGREGASRGEGEERGRTPWEILAAFAETGDVEELARWHAYEQGTKGKRSITWSRGLRDAVDAGEEQTDEELAEEEVGGEVVLTLPLSVWSKLCARPGAVLRVLSYVENFRDEAAWAVAFDTAGDRGPP